MRPEPAETLDGPALPTIEASIQKLLEHTPPATLQAARDMLSSIAEALDGSGPSQ